MKLYNPFKPHLVQFKNGKYAVRRYCFPFGWAYRDKTFDDKSWWAKPQRVIDWCLFSSKLQAEELLLKITTLKPKRDFGTKV